MKRIFYLSVLAFTITSCTAQSGIPSTTKNAHSNTFESKAFISANETITTKDLKKHLYIIAGDEMEGRDTGSKGQKKAGKYMIEEYKKMGVSHPKSMTDFYQKVPAEFMNGGFGKLPDSENILAFIEGSEKPEEIIVISAHYDHVGMDSNGEVFNGADDDGSGTVGVMEIAEAFQYAKKMGNGPKRSILFLHVTGEEHGLHGSRYYAENPIFPMANTVVDMNIDMIGRDDPENRGKDYVYVIGSEMLSKELKVISEDTNKKTTNLLLNYKYDDKNDPDRLYYRSDHYNFAKNGVPVIFYFDGIHEDYHKPTDTPDKIDYELLQKRTKLVFATAWELANRAERIKVD